MSHTLYRGEFLALIREKHWEYAVRTNATGAAIILAITGEDKLLLVEQYRIPLHARTIELPAGIIGDEPGAGAESHAEAARRELREETGYDAGRMEVLTHGPASGGLTSETVTIFQASELQRSGAGGGNPPSPIATVLTLLVLTAGCILAALPWRSDQLFLVAHAPVKVRPTHAQARQLEIGILDLGPRDHALDLAEALEPALGERDLLVEFARLLLLAGDVGRADRRLDQGKHVARRDRCAKPRKAARRRGQPTRHRGLNETGGIGIGNDTTG